MQQSSRLSLISVRVPVGWGAPLSEIAIVGKKRRAPKCFAEEFSALDFVVDGYTLFRVGLVVSRTAARP
jgi:hypothetical protein